MGGDIYLPFGKASVLGKELEFLADCSQKDHCPVNKITFMPHLNGMFKGTLCLRGGTIQCRAWVLMDISVGAICSLAHLGSSIG